MNIEQIKNTLREIQAENRQKFKNTQAEFKLVIQGSHMVSGTRCPAEWSSEEVEWEQGSGPKGPMSCRTQGGISRRPSIRPSVLPSFPPSPPRWPSRPQISPPRPQFSRRGLKSALLASNQPPMPQICPRDLKSALQTFNQPSIPQNGSPSLNSALQPSNMPSVA